MNRKWLESHPLTVFLVVTTAGLAAWVGMLLTVWLFLRLLGIDTSYWAMVEALSTAVAAAAVLGAGFVASRELNELSASRHLDVADRLFNELNSVENIAARRWVYQNLPADPAEGLHTMTPEGQAAVKTVLNSLDRVAFLTQADWIPEEMIMPWLNPMVVKAWHKLGPYVAYESRRRHEPDYYRTARELAERCLAWRRTHVAATEIAWVEDAL